MITDLVVLDRPLISLDLETTGLQHKSDRIVQIGIIKIYPDGHMTEFESLLNPGIQIPEEASAVHHITNEIVEGEPTFADLAPTLYAGLKECDLLGYNLHAFDIKFLIAEFNRCSIKFPIPRIVDAYKLFLRYYPRNLKNAVFHYLKEDLEDAHSALADAKASLRVFREQLLIHPDIPRSVQEIHDAFFTKAGIDPEGRIIWGPDNEACINFGKHKGQPLRLVPKQYRQWLSNDAETSEEIKFIIKESLAGRYPVKEQK